MLRWEMLPGVEVFWPGLVALGVGIGFLTGLFGVGGGFLLTPCLRILFGIPYPLAVGSGLMQIFCIGTVSAFKHWRRGNVDVRLGVVMAVGASAGAWVGKYFLGLLQNRAGVMRWHGRELPWMDLVMNGLFLLFMTVVLISILRETAGAKGEEANGGNFARRLRAWRFPPLVAFAGSRIEEMSLWTPLGLSLVVGVLIGLMGVGGGFVMFPLLVYGLGVPTTIAVGTSAFQLVFATGCGSYMHYCAGNVHLLLVGILLAGSLVGVQLGVRASGLLGGAQIRKYFAGVIALGIVVIVYSLAGMLL